MSYHEKTYSEQLEEEYRQDWLEELNYKRSGRKVDGARELEKLLREIERMTRPSTVYHKKYKKQNSRKYGFTGHYSSKNNYMQNCTVKVSYENDNVKKHLSFLKDYIPQENKLTVKDKPVLFNDVEDSVSDGTVLEYVDDIDQKFYRIIVSPERQDVPGKVFIRAFMKFIEEQTDCSLSWFAGEHNDTGHRHYHILINGHDKNGKDVFLPRELVCGALRNFARIELTNLFGYRTEKEIEEERKKQKYARRWTRLDNRIKNYCKEYYVSEESQYPFHITAMDSDMQLRLLFLTELGCALRVGKQTYPGRFILKKDWEDYLKTIGAYNIFPVVGEKLHYVDKDNLTLYKPEDGIVEGVITSIYKQNFEGGWSNGIVIENRKKNKAWFVPTRNVPLDNLVGAVVNFNSKTKGRQFLKNNLNVLSWGK